MTKRILSLLLAFALAIALLPVVSVFAAEYNLYICNTQVTDANKADILGDGVFSFDPATNTLTVAGDCTNGDKNIIQNGYRDEGLGNLTIYVAKDSLLYGTSTLMYLYNVNVTITGPGKLTLTTDSDYTAIWLVGSSSKLTIKDADLTVDSCWWAIHGTDSPAVEIINSDVWFKSTTVDTQHALGDLGALKLTDCALALPADGVVESSGIFHADGTWAEEVKIVKKAVTAFNVTVPDPVVGQKPATTAKITTTPSDANVTVTSIEWFWWDNDIEEWAEITGPAYVFEAGKIYGVDIEIVAGADTAFDPAVDGTLNGKPCAPQYGPVYVDTTHAYIGIDWDELPANGELTNPFVDIGNTDYFYDAVLWAYYHTPQVTNGLDATHFGPYATCTRGQIVTFLWRALGEPEPTITKNPFVDVKTTDYYYKAVLWAYENGVTTGTDATHFAPNAYCKREHAVAFLYRAAGKPAYTGKTNPFKDVSSSAYYYDAVLWAVENNITKGMDATHFGPSSSCQRCQIVTFLYRFMNP